MTRLLAIYHERYISRERPRTAAGDQGQIDVIVRVPIPSITGTDLPFGQWAVMDITTDTIERFREVRREHGGGAVGVNRNLALLRACFNWAIRVGYRERTPFKRGTETVVRLSREIPRSRRLEGDEGPRLLDVCGDHLRAVVEAALETGMRRTEILGLQWRQIRLTPRADIFLPAQKTKAMKDRRIPMSKRLQAVIEMRRLDPAGHVMPMDSFVFGDEIGEPVKSITRTWATAVLKSHDKTPTWMRGHLTPASRAEYRAIDLHLHDLRREAGSRWLEGGVPLHKIRDWLGHANIAQTSTYLAGTETGDDDAMRRFEQQQVGGDQDVTRHTLPGQVWQKRGNEVGKGGSQGPRSAVGRDKKPNKTGVGRDLD